MRYDISSAAFNISVEELCLTVLRSGDIDCRRRDARSLESSYSSDISAQLCAEYGSRYHASVELCNTCKLDGEYYCVSGRADGIICDSGAYTVCEIVPADVSAHITDDKNAELHTARAYCYAYFMCRAKELDGIFVDTVTGKGRKKPKLEHSVRYVKLDEARDVYTSLLMRMIWRAKLLKNRLDNMTQTAANARFPYKSLRDSQEEMIRECYRDIRNGNRLFCQAPTGIGKTVSTLYSAVKCMGNGVADKIFYLTSKQSIRLEALSAVSKMNSVGVRIRSCVISSREAMCPNVAAKNRGGRLSSSCNPDVCPYAKGYYDRYEEALKELIGLSERYDSKTIRAVAQEKKICPYELSLDLSELCDVVICDYNYVFSPSVCLRRYFGDGGRYDTEKYIFLIDEAHNLPDRARDMFSAELSETDFEYIAAALDDGSPLSEACLAVIKRFARLGELCSDNMKYLDGGDTVGYSVSRSLPQNFSDELDAYLKKSESWLKRNADSPISLAVEELAVKVLEYKRIADRYDRQYITFIHIKNGSTSVLLYCLDPSSELSAALDRACASVLFSATLTPAEYYADILGGDKRSVSVTFKSPFPSENLCVAVADGISTRFEDRGDSYKKISACIAATVSAKVGNYMVFFSSYGYMEEVRRVFEKKYPKVPLLVQKKNMSFAEKEKFISSFADDGKLRIGFCVIGGSFAEGIDLPGKRLIGAIVVGVGLPGISNENNMIRDYYDEKCGVGYDYAYTYPGMNSVLQAVGRVIRTEKDVGIAVLIDDRYSEKKYTDMFPQEWGKVKYARSAQILAEIVRDFWKLQ